MLALVLASSSRYRKDLLHRLRIPFDTAHPQVDEAPVPGEVPDRLVTRLAKAKAQAVAPCYPGALIIGSDQVAVAGDTVLGKPGGHDEAVAQLTRVSGQRLTFMTALCLMNSDTHRMQCDVVNFAVVFRTLSRDTIDRYVTRERPYDCAGAFKSEGLGVSLVERFEGDDPTALIGLPLIRLIDMLAREDVIIP